MDLMPLAARFTKALPHRLGASIGWRLGERASRRERVARLRTGGRVVVDVRDHVHRPMFFLGEYETPTTRLLRRIAFPSWTVIDIGANVGYFSVVTADLGGPGSIVTAFEPNPRLHTMLLRTAGMNMAAITAERAACGDQSGHLPLHLSPEGRNSGLSTLRPDLFTDASTVMVPVVTLDSYCAARGLRPALIKIDVEGYEFEVLRGAEAMISDGTPRWIICEISPARFDPSALFDWMEARGYTVHRITDEGLLAPLVGVTQYFENVCFAGS